MSTGKYSPTVTRSYQEDQEWWNKHIDPNNPLYDKDGYDSYGYDVYGKDRAGYTDDEYLLNYDDYYEEYVLYKEKILEEWNYLINNYTTKVTDESK